MEKLEKESVWYEEVPMDKIDIERNIRTEIGDVSGLMTSIDQQGLMHPVGLYLNPNANGRYILRFGHRRFAACRKLGWVKIPAMISNKEIKDDNYKDFLLQNFGENKNRKDTTPVEDGRIFVELQNEYKMSFSEVSAATGTTVTYIKNAVAAFLKTPNEYKMHVGHIGGGNKKKGKFSAEMVSMVTRDGISKNDSKKLFEYIKSHDEATLQKVRLIVRLMESRASNSPLTLEDAIKKVDNLKVFSLFVTVRRNAEDAARKKYEKSLNSILVDVLTGKIPPIKGLVYNNREDRE